MQEIYQPQEDSYFFQDFLKKTLKNKNLSFLDMGCGSCILADTANKIGLKEITCIDTNLQAVKLAKQKGYKATKSNLFKDIPKNKKFDIICFNAPYLPLDKKEPKDSQIITTGGKNGDEISLKFIKQAKNHLNKNGIIYLLISSLTPKQKINKYKPKTVARKKIFFEELQILKIIN